MVLHNIPISAKRIMMQNNGNDHFIDSKIHIYINQHIHIYIKKEMAKKLIFTINLKILYPQKRENNSNETVFSKI